MLYQVKPKLFIILLEEMIRQFCRHVCIHGLFSILFSNVAHLTIRSMHLSFLGGKTTNKIFKGEVVIEVVRCKLTLG